MRIGSAGSRPISANLVRRMSKTVLITGSRGYLGSCVKAKFEQAGWKTVEMIRKPTEDELRSGTAIRFLLGEAVSPETLAGADALVHCAYDFSPRSWSGIHAANIAGTEKLFRAAGQAGVARTICISSMSAYPGCKALYGKAKLGIERIAFQAGALVVRPGLIYGDNPRGMFGQLVAQVRASKIVPVFQNGSQIQYLTHQGDLCQMLYEYAFQSAGTVNEPVTAAHEQPWRFRKLLEEIAAREGRRLRFVNVPWRLVWLVIKGFEIFHLPFKFRSDSVISLVSQNPNPSFNAKRQAGFKFRPFEIGKIKL